MPFRDWVESYGGVTFGKGTKCIGVIYWGPHTGIWAVTKKYYKCSVKMGTLNYSPGSVQYTGCVIKRALRALGRDESATGIVLTGLRAAVARVPAWALTEIRKVNPKHQDEMARFLSATGEPGAELLQHDVGWPVFQLWRLLTNAMKARKKAMRLGGGDKDDALGSYYLPPYRPLGLKMLLRRTATLKRWADLEFITPEALAGLKHAFGVMAPMHDPSAIMDRIMSGIPERAFYHVDRGALQFDEVAYHDARLHWSLCVDDPTNYPKLTNPSRDNSILGNQPVAVANKTKLSSLFNLHTALSESGLPVTRFFLGLRWYMRLSRNVDSCGLGHCVCGHYNPCPASNARRWGTGKFSLTFPVFPTKATPTQARRQRIRGYVLAHLYPYEPRDNPHPARVFDRFVISKKFECRISLTQRNVVTLYAPDFSDRPKDTLVIASSLPTNPLITEVGRLQKTAKWYKLPGHYETPIEVVALAGNRHFQLSSAQRRRESLSFKPTLPTVVAPDSPAI